MAAADIAPGTLLLVERRFLPMPTAMECGLAGGVGQVNWQTRVLGLSDASLLASSPLFLVLETF